MPEHDPAGPEPCPCRECQKLFALIIKGLADRLIAQVLSDLGYPPSWAEALTAGEFQKGGLVGAKP